VVLPIGRVSRKFVRLPEPRTRSGSLSVTNWQLGFDPYFGNSVRDASPIFVRLGRLSSKRSIPARRPLDSPIHRVPSADRVVPRIVHLCLERIVLVRRSLVPAAVQMHQVFLNG
jgi:hypothetical protein